MEDQLKFNVTHKIRTLFFGAPIPGVEMPLNGIEQVMPEGVYTMIPLLPTRAKLIGQCLASCQAST